MLELTDGSKKSIWTFRDISHNVRYTLLYCWPRVDFGKPLINFVCSKSLKAIHCHEIHVLTSTVCGHLWHVPPTCWLWCRHPFIITVFPNGSSFIQQDNPPYHTAEIVQELFKGHEQVDKLLWTVGWNQNTEKKPMQAQGEYKNTCTRRPLSTFLL